MPLVKKLADSCGCGVAHNHKNLKVSQTNRQDDPTGQSRNRKRGTTQLDRRLNAAERQVKALVREIPRTRRQETILTNRTIPVYDYQITASELELLEERIRLIIGDQLLETEFNRMPPNWWWQSVIEPPYRDGTMQEIIWFNQMVTAELIRIRAENGLVTQRLEIEQVINSSQYRQTLNRVFVRNFATIKTLSDRVSDQVIQQINDGISAGNTPTDISQRITDRFDVGRSDAKRIADTEVNRAYNDARLDATDVAAKATGLRAGVLHLSALILTSRRNHVARHGNAYTVAQQRQWWDSGSNRINCHCSTRSVLIDNKGNVIDVELQEELRVERKKFDL